MQLLRKSLLLALSILPLMFFSQQTLAGGLKFFVSGGGHHGYHHNYHSRPSFALSFSSGYYPRHYYSPRVYYGYRHYRNHAWPRHSYGHGYRHGYRHGYHHGSRHHRGHHKRHKAGGW